MKRTPERIRKVSMRLGVSFKPTQKRNSAPSIFANANQGTRARRIQRVLENQPTLRSQLGFGLKRGAKLACLILRNGKRALQND
jgi:hypothetical protein